MNVDTLLLLPIVYVPSSNPYIRRKKDSLRLELLGTYIPDLEIRLSIKDLEVFSQHRIFQFAKQITDKYVCQ